MVDRAGRFWPGTVAGFNLYCIYGCLLFIARSVGTFRSIGNLYSLVVQEDNDIQVGKTTTLKYLKVADQVIRDNDKGRNVIII